MKKCLYLTKFFERYFSMQNESSYSSIRTFKLILFYLTECYLEFNHALGTVPSSPAPDSVVSAWNSYDLDSKSLDN